MPATFSEAWDSGSGAEDATGQGSTRTLTFHVLDTESEEEANQCAKDNLPAFFRYWPFRGYRLEFQGGDVWRGEAEYGYGGTGATKVTFSTRGGTRHITQSLLTEAYSADGDAPDFQGAIGVNGDTVEGVDVISPVLHFTEEHLVPLTRLLEPTFINTLVGLTGRTNTEPFRGFQAGEVLFYGAEGGYEVPIVPDPDPDLKYPVTYEFAASPNKEDVQIGDIGPITKRGFAHVWVRYKESADGKALLKVPAYVYVETVYDEGDLNDLFPPEEEGP